MKSLIGILCFSFLILASILHSCRKEAVPILKTASVTNITATTATSGGWITEEGSGTIAVKLKLTLA